MITDLKDLLSSIGYDRLTEDGSYWRTNALYRDGDNRTSLRINKRTGKFQDFVDKRYGTIEELIKLTLRIGDVELKRFYEGNHVDLNSIVERNDRPKITMEKIWPETELNNLLPHYKFYEDKGISKETLKTFKSGFAHSGSMNQRFVFPIYNMDGKIHGWSGRDMTAKKEAKWKHIGRKAAWVYPAFVPYNIYKDGKLIEVVHECLNEIRRKREVILVESIGDMLALWERRIKNVLVTFGLVVSARLGSFISSIPLDRVIVALNNDMDSDINRGKNAAIDMFIDLMHYFDPEKLNVALPPSNDFGAINDEQFNEWTGKYTIVDRQLYRDALDVLTVRYKEKRITAAEIKFGKQLRYLYEQTEGS